MASHNDPLLVTFEMRSAPTTTIETVTIVRPLKIIALICLIVSVILLIVCLSTSYWLKSDGFRTGLFEECLDSSEVNPKGIVSPPPVGGCQRVVNRGNVYIFAVAALLIIAGICDTIGVVLIGIAIRTLSNSRKSLYYRSALYLALFAVLLELIGLIVFPVCFYLELKDWGRPRWDFDWAYGVAWGGTLFTFGACLLLLCDKEHQEVYYKEKTVMHESSVKDGRR